MEKKKDRGMNKIVAMEKELDVEYDADAKLVKSYQWHYRRKIWMKLP